MFMGAFGAAALGFSSITSVLILPQTRHTLYINTQLPPCRAQPTQMEQSTDSTNGAASEVPKVPSTIQISMLEPALQGVKPEDRVLVRNVIYLLHACKHPARLCVSWNVAATRRGDGYEITGLLDPTKDYEIFKEDLDFITLADPLRVKSICIRRMGDAPQIMIHVLSKSEPIMMTELDVVTMRKKRRMWGGQG